MCPLSLWLVAHSIISLRFRRNVTEAANVIEAANVETDVAIVHVEAAIVHVEAAIAQADVANVKQRQQMLRLHCLPRGCLLARASPALEAISRPHYARAWQDRACMDPQALLG